MEDSYTNKKSVDQAWNVMKDILDKEMPVKEKRRFMFIPLLLGAAIFLGIGYAVYLWYPSNTSVPQPNEDFVTNEVSKEIAVHNSTEYNMKYNKSADITSVKQKKELPTKLSTIDNAHQKVGFIKPSLSNTKLNTNAESKLPNTDIRQGEAIASRNKNEDVVIAAQSLLDLSIGSLQILEDDSIKQLDDSIMQNKTKQTSDRPIFIPSPVLATVAGFAKFSILDEGINTKVRPSTYSKESRKLKLNWDVNLYGAQRLWIRKSQSAFGPKLKDLGNLAGLEILFSTIHKNWRIGSGLGYKFSGTTFGNRPSDLSGLPSAASFNEEFSEFIGGDSSALGIEVEFNGPQTHFVSIPLFLDRSLNQKWSVETGIRYNQKIGNFRSVFFKQFRRSNVDFYLMPRFEILNGWSLGLVLQHSTNQFNLFNTLLVKERGRTQLGLVSRIRI